MFHLQETLNANTKLIADIAQANAEQSVCLTYMQIILAGSLAFAVLDRFTGTWSVVNREWAASLIDQLLGTPFLWFIFNMLLWLAFGYYVLRTVKKKGAAKALQMDIKIRLNEECNIEMLDIYLSDKSIMSENIRYDKNGVVQEITWIEAWSRRPKWGGTAPKITIVYDDEHGYILDVLVNYSRAEGGLKPKEVREAIMQELLDGRVIAERDDDEDLEDDDDE